AGLVRKGGRTDVWLPGKGNDVGDLGDRVRDACRFTQPIALERDRIALEFEVGGDGHHVSIAGAFAVAVDTSLDVRGTGSDRGHRVRHRTAGVVVGVHA